MPFDALIVPRGAEAQAVERGWPAPRPALVRVPAGASSAAGLQTNIPGTTALVLGLCGALDPVLRVGDAVVYGEIVRADGGGATALDAALAASCARRLGCRVVRAATVDAVVGEIAAKRRLRTTTGAAVIDMESAALFAALTARGIRTAMVRVVSDDAHTELPDLRDAYDDGSLRTSALALAFVRSPGRSIRFARHALQGLAMLRAASARLAAPE